MRLREKEERIGVGEEKRVKEEKRERGKERKKEKKKNEGAREKILFL